MQKTFTKAALGLFVLLNLSSEANAQIAKIKDYQNNVSANIGTYQGINFREAGFSGLYPIPGTEGREFWVCSDRGRISMPPMPTLRVAPLHTIRYMHSHRMRPKYTA